MSLGIPNMGMWLQKLTSFAHDILEPLQDRSSFFQQSNMALTKTKTAFSQNEINYSLLKTIPLAAQQMLIAEGFLSDCLPVETVDLQCQTYKTPRFLPSNIFECAKILCHLSNKTQDYSFFNSICLKKDLGDSIKENLSDLVIQRTTPRNLILDIDFESLTSENKTMMKNMKNSNQVLSPVTDTHIVASVTVNSVALDSKMTTKSSIGIYEEKMPKPTLVIDFNQELTVRKTKELNKHSKKRRRRQKKKQLPTTSCPKNGNTSMPIPHGGFANDLFVIEAHGASQNCNQVISVTLRDVTDRIELTVTSSDDDDWDAVDSSCDRLDEAEFGFSGLFFTNLMTPTMGGTTHFFAFGPNSETCDILKKSYKASSALCRVNKAWRESMKGLDEKSRLPSKVSFAPDNSLVQVAYVETYERKGEWERYACERQRFRRRIEKLETILSPFLTEQHRSKVAERQQGLNL